ncbi:MAG: hypothetical protein WD361_15815 [Gracilimonas sp.]
MDFQGFQHILPPAVIIIIIAALFVLSWVSYRKFDSIPAISRWALISLRGAALSLLLLLLMNPYFYSSREFEQNPGIAVFLDNSESTGITKGNYDGLSSYHQLINTLNFEGVNDVDFKFYSIGEEVRDFHPDSINASETQTNLSAPVLSVLEMEEQIQAVIIITDGIITFGRNPTVTASNSSIPLYTIGIGDTANVKDISVSNVHTNATGYTNTTHIIEAEITQTGFANTAINVALLSEDEVLSEQQVSFETNNQVKKVRFEHDLKEAGLRQFEIRAEYLPNEWTPLNNSRLFSIEVLDSKVKILHVAFEIHPDVKAIRSIIRQDENNDLTTLTSIGGNRFIEELPNENDFNLIIIHGKPNSNFDNNIFTSLAETPTIFFELSRIQGNRFSQLEYLQLINPRTNQISQVTLNQLLNSNEQPIMELPEVNLSEAPPLFSPLRTQISAPLSTPLYSINIENVPTDFPVIAIMEQGNIRRSHVIPWGWFRMIQSTNRQNRNYAETLISNLVSWTSSDPDNRKLRVAPVKQSFSTSETPVLNGSLQNERSEPETEGIIEVQIESKDKETRTFNMENLGNGNYRLNLPQLSEGLYKYTATARKGAREIESQKGEFLVSNTSSEFTNTTRNDALLQSVAKNSGGVFFTFENAEALWDTLNTANVLQKQNQTIEKYSYPVQNIYWFIVVLFLLGTEWFIRKYYSLP